MASKRRHTCRLKVLESLPSSSSLSSRTESLSGSLSSSFPILSSSSPSSSADEVVQKDEATDMRMIPVALPLPGPTKMEFYSKAVKLLSLMKSLIYSSLTPSSCTICPLVLPPPSAQQSSICNRVTGTLFGPRKGHVHFVVQEMPRTSPALLLELGIPTYALIKEMASGSVRIVLECQKRHSSSRLLLEQVWIMYCNGRKAGYAWRRSSADVDLQVLQLVQAVSMGAGVLPITGGEAGGGGAGDRDRELMYMRATFERVVGSKDCEAFYMINPNGSGVSELSLFLLRS